MRLLLEDNPGMAIAYPNEIPFIGIIRGTRISTKGRTDSMHDDRHA